MTQRRPAPPKLKKKPQPPPNSSNQADDNKPYFLVPLSEQGPDCTDPIGRERFQPGCLSGQLSLKLTVKTGTTVLSGLTVLGSDLSSQTRNIPLVKTAIENNQNLIIPGSSLKGAIRAAYEAITRSCLCKVPRSYKQGKQNIPIKLPKGYQECKQNNQKKPPEIKVCPACQIFGAMGWQGLVGFADA